MIAKKHQKLLGGLLLPILMGSSQLPVAAQNIKPSNPSLWGYTGILTVPTAQMSGDQTFHLGARYFPLNTGFGGGGYLNLFDDLEIGFAIGFPPLQRTSFGGNLKYRIFDQDKNQPVSVAAGATLIGLSTANNNSYVAGNNLFLMMSRDFYWPFITDRAFHFLSLHGGFLGDFTHLRVAGGIEVPILEYAKIKAEYLGPTANIPNQHTINFGANITPFPFLDITFGIMQVNSSNFLTRDFIAQIGYRGKFPFDIRFNPQPNPNPRATPGPVPTSNVPGQPGQLSGRVFDQVTNKPLSDQEITLSTKSFDLVLNARTDSQGNFSFLDVPAGEYEVLVHGGNGWGSQTRSVVIQAQKETSLQVALKSNSGQLSGQVMAAGSTAGMRVELKRRGSSQIQAETAVDNGIYRFSGVAPGEYLLMVKDPDGKSLSGQSVIIKAGTILRINIDVKTPEAKATTPPSADSKSKPQLFGTIKDDKSQGVLQGVRLKMESKDVTILTLTGSDGSYSFRDLPNGTYRLTVSKSGFKTRIFQVTIRQKEESLSHSITLKKE